MQRMSFYFLIGKGDEFVAVQTEKAKKNPDSPIESNNLIIALIYAEKFEEAYTVFKEAIKKFSDDWRMYIHGGDMQRSSKNVTKLLNAITKQAKSEHISVMKWIAKSVYMKKRENSKRLIITV